MLDSQAGQVEGLFRLPRMQGLSGLYVQRVIWTPITLFLDSLDTQKFMSEFADDDFS